MNPRIASAASARPQYVQALRGPEVTNLAEDNTDYAAALYLGVARDPGSFVVSPYSLAVALAMIYTGAQSETARQMAEAMRWHGGRNSRRGGLWFAGTRHEQVPSLLHQANAVWVQEGTPMREEYAPMVAIAFGALAASVDFYDEPLHARSRINHWALEQTEGAVGEMVPEHFIDHNTRLLVTSALRLTAGWRVAFDSAATVQRTFVDSAGTARSVAMMRTSQRLRSGGGAGWRAVELPFESEQISMLVILPDDFASFEASLTASVLDEAVESLTSGVVDLSLPRFNLQSTMSLRPVLQALGMKRAFREGQADLGGIDRTHHLYLSDVIHHADMRVDEAGVYATTAVGSPGGGEEALNHIRSSAPTTFVVDKPFVVMVRDTDSGAPLLMGRVLSP